MYILVPVILQQIFKFGNWSDQVNLKIVNEITLWPDSTIARQFHHNLMWCKKKKFIFSHRVQYYILMYCRLKTNKFPSLFLSLSLHALRTFSEFIEFSRKVISTHIISQTHTQRKRNATAIILLFLTLGCMHAMISVWILLFSCPFLL